MKSKIYLLILLFSISSRAFTQPGIDWIRSYDYGGDDAFWDIYKVPGDGYAACGATYGLGGIRSSDVQGDLLVVRIDEDGEERWNHIRDLGENRAGLWHIIETDSLSFVSAGYRAIERNQYQTLALHVDRDGELIWYNEYVEGDLHAVIELKSGEFLFSGGSERQGYVLCTNLSGDVLWEELYPGNQSGAFWSMRETQGGVVLVGYTRGDRDIDYWVVKINFEGEVIWSNTHDIQGADLCVDLYSCRDGGFILCGYSISGQFYSSALKITDNGALEWSRTYQIIEGEAGSTLGCVVRMENDDFIFVGKQGRAPNFPSVMRTHPNGVPRWRTFIDFFEIEGYQGGTNYFNSLILGEDQAITAAGTVNHEEEEIGNNGLIIKLLPDIVNPQFISWTPEDTVLTVLVGDSIAFSVEVLDNNMDDVSYEWELGEEVISDQDSVGVIFDELGEFEVICRVSDDEVTVSITWHVTVDDIFMVGFSPEDSELIVRRNELVPFIVNYTCIEPEEIQYEWTLTDRNRRGEIIGDSDSLEFVFEYSGEHRLTASVTYGEDIEETSWEVLVRSVLWWWQPQEDSVTVFQDSTHEFSIEPSYPDSDSLSYTWRLDGEIIEDAGTNTLTLSLNELGVHNLIGIVTDGCESDSVGWIVTVEEENVISQLEKEIPHELKLYGATPNPFNSTTLITYALPKSGFARLVVYDIMGREMSVLHEGELSTGRSTSELSALEWSSGVYFVRLQMGVDVRTLKVICVK